MGTRCDVALLLATMDDAMVLQLKEALPSVLEQYAGKSRYPNHGERVVTGQRMLQAASDVFLGWTRAPISAPSPRRPTPTAVLCSQV